MAQFKKLNKFYNLLISKQFFDIWNIFFQETNFIFVISFAEKKNALKLYIFV